MMRDRDDHDAIGRYPIHHRKGEAPHREAPCSVDVRRPALRCFRDEVDCSVERRNKPVRGFAIPLFVPAARAPSLLCRFRVKDDGSATHSSPAMRRRASDHGMGVTLPSSSSLMRRSITGPQSASYSEGWSGSSSSRLRSSSAASRARACWESSRASLRRSRGSRAMPEVYGSSSSVTTARTLVPRDLRRTPRRVRAAACARARCA